MDEPEPQPNPPPDFNKIDLSQLQSFSFGTQWTQDKPSAREPRRDDRPRRDDGAAPDRRDRRTFRRPAGGDAGAPVENRAPRREHPGDDRGPARPAGEFRGGPRRDGDGGGRFAPRGAPMDRGPYDSPFFHATFYPEDTSFATLAKTIRASCRTFELFDIARTVIGKPDRFVVVLHRKAAGEVPPGAEAPKPDPIALSAPDGIPFESEDAAIAHVLGRHLGTFFDISDVEVDPPKGNFQVVNKCGVTGELLSPPNYHRYGQIVQQHFATRVSKMPFDAFRARIETVRDPEAIAQWLEKMKKATRYTWKLDRPAAPAAALAVSAAPEAPNAPASETAPADGGAATAVATDPVAPPSEVPAPAVVAFDTLEEARNHLLTKARDKVVRVVESARFHGKVIETLPPGEIRRAIEGTLERQRRFPLDTANALRGRLRREGFTIFKKGSKGVSYVCAVKRRFRVPGQVFSDGITGLITYIEAHPMVKAGDLAERYLGFALPAPAAAEGAAPPSPVEVTPEQREKLARMQGDLRWLVHEGYVTEFIDGGLFAPLPMVEARKKEIEATEHDPENFPEATMTEAAPAPETAAPEAAPVPAEAAPVAEVAPEPNPPSA